MLLVLRSIRTLVGLIGAFSPFFVIPVVGARFLEWGKDNDLPFLLLAAAILIAIIPTWYLCLHVFGYPFRLLDTLVEKQEREG